MILERTTVHVSDDGGRIAMLEKRVDEEDETLVRYVYSNHLQSASLELDENAAIVSYEEYHPYGTTAFQAKSATINAVAKRYRYTGKERDEESGLYYHGARYYIPWLCRWTASDPMESKYAGMSPYNYSFNNPIMWNDLSGADPGGEEKLSSFKVKKEYFVGRAPSTHQVLVPKGWEVATSSPINSDGKVIGLSTVIGLKSPKGNTYVWNDSSNWFTNSKGEDYSNPGVRGFAFDITNWVESTTKASVGQMAKDAIETGDPFKAIKESYNSYKEDGGGYGVIGYLGTGVKDAAVQTYGDIKAGGYRRNQAVIGLWQTTSAMAKGSVFPSVASATNFFRGTSVGLPGLASLQSLGITPTTINPAIATAFATVSDNTMGRGIVYIASKADLKGIKKVIGNTLDGLEKEVPFEILPSEFAKKASISISVKDARSILSKMGIHVPSDITQKTLSSTLMYDIPSMTNKQIKEFIKQAKMLNK